MSSGTRQRARQRRVALAWFISAVGAAVATLADAAPTGLTLPDAVYRGLYGLAVGLACAYARRWTWPIVAGAALLIGPTNVWALAAVAALAVATVSQADRRRRQQVGALVGVLAAQSLLRLPPVLAFGVPSLVAFAAPLPAVLSALSSVRSSAHRPLVIAGAVVAGTAVVVAAGFGIGLMMVRSDAKTGVRHARLGIADLRAGDEAAATARFANAARSFARAHDITDAWWMAPARAVPIAGQHLDVASIISAEGRSLAELSAATAPVVSLNDLTTADGRFRLDHVAELESLAGEVVTALERSRATLDTVSTDWLTSPMAGAVAELRAEIDDSLPDARLATTALDLAPDLLGGDEPKTYIVLFGNPAEARAMGGFVASIGALTADGGVLSFASLETPGTLEGALVEAGAQLTIDVPAPVRSAQPARYVRNWTDSPDIDTVSAIVADLLPRVPGAPRVDGVLYVDPYVVEALLELTGPVTIPETGTQLTTDNVVDFLLRGQYLEEAFEPGVERKERLGDAGEAAFDRLIAGGIPRPRRLSDLLSPVVRARRLLFSTTEPSPHDLLERVGLRPSVRTGGETVLVTHGARRPSKLDAYLERAIDYRAEIDQHGDVTATLTVELTNQAPRSGLVPYQTGAPRPGDTGPEPTNHITLDAYSTLDGTEVLVDGRATPYNELSAYGLNLYSVPVSIAPGAKSVVEISLKGSVDPDSCRFTFIPNAGASHDTLQWGIISPKVTEIVDHRAFDDQITAICDTG